MDEFGGGVEARTAYWTCAAFALRFSPDAARARAFTAEQLVDVVRATPECFERETDVDLLSAALSCLKTIGPSEFHFRSLLLIYSYVISFNNLNTLYMYSLIDVF